MREKTTKQVIRKSKTLKDVMYEDCRLSLRCTHYFLIA